MINRVMKPAKAPDDVWLSRCQPPVSELTRHGQEAKVASIGKGRVHSSPAQHRVLSDSLFASLHVMRWSTHVCNNLLLTNGRNLITIGLAAPSRHAGYRRALGTERRTGKVRPRDRVIGLQTGGVRPSELCRLTHCGNAWGACLITGWRAAAPPDFLIGNGAPPRLSE